jgi:hypothetical protein
MCLLYGGKAKGVQTLDGNLTQFYDIFYFFICACVN